MRFLGGFGRHHIRQHGHPTGEGMYLDRAVPGKTYIMVALEGGRFFREKIYSMGLNPGVKFKVLLNSGHGPVELEARQTKLAIGRFMANRIRIKENESPG
jgi:Fe2+ transport system protein FeoA